MPVEGRWVLYHKYQVVLEVFSNWTVCFFLCVCDMLFMRLSEGVFSMSMLRNRFGKRLRQVRRQQDITQEQLAEAVGISPTFLSNLERGINGPSFEILEKIAQVLHVPVRELFDFPEEGKS